MSQEPQVTPKSTVSLPGHLLDNPGRLFLLRRWANGVAGLYGEPVFLCGSALNPLNSSPRDWDVRLRLEPADFEARYGDPERWDYEGVTGEWTEVRWRWAADNVKQSRRAWRHTRLNVDFQTVPAAHWDRVYGDSPRARLDTMPADFAAMAEDDEKSEQTEQSN